MIFEHSFSRVRIALLIVLLAPNYVLSAATDISLAELEAGPMSVGVTVWHRVDPNRLSVIAGDNDHPRQVQIMIWYPSIGAGNQPAMTVRDYLLTAETVPETGSYIDFVRELAVSQGSDLQFFEEALVRETLAGRDAIPLAGKYPLVLFAPGLGAPAFQNLGLAEYLASNGFVVAAIPSIGASSIVPVGGIDDLNSYRQDLEIAFEALKGFPAADMGHVGVVGYSFGGMAVTLMSMTNERIDAVVTHDPGFMVQKNRLTIESSDDYSTADLVQPFLILMSGGVKFRPDLTVASAVSTDVQAFSVNPMRHGDFASLLVDLFLNTSADGAGRDKDLVNKGYVCVSRMSHEFLRSTLKKTADTVQRQICASEMIRNVQIHPVGAN